MGASDGARAFSCVCAAVLALVSAMPCGAESYAIYRGLVTTYSGLTVVDSQADPYGLDNPDRWPQTSLTGEVWQNGSDIDWTKVPGVHPYTIGGVPAPDVLGFYA